jgi:hypothetical protein
MAMTDEDYEKLFKSLKGKNKGDSGVLQKYKEESKLGEKKLTPVPMPSYSSEDNPSYKERKLTPVPMPSYSQDSLDLNKKPAKITDDGMMLLKNGGYVKSADGIAQRGKTKGRMC